MADSSVETAIYKLAYQTSDSVRELNASRDAALENVQAAEQLSQAEEKVSRSTRSSTEAMERMLARLDPRIRAEQELQRTIDQANRLAQEGIGTEQQRTQIIDLATRKYLDQVAALQRATAGQKQLTQAIQETSAMQQRVNTATGVRTEFGTAGRAEDIAAYGKALDDVRAKYNPLFAATRSYNESIADVNNAVRTGAISETEHAAAIRKTRGEYETQVKALKEAEAGTINYGAALSGVKSSLAALGIVLSAEAVARFSISLFKSTAALEDEAKQIGVGTDALQAFRAGALEAGAAADVGDVAMRRFTRSIGEAREQAGPTRQAFRELHITANDLAGSPESSLQKTAAALLKINDVTERARLEVVLFARSGQAVEGVLEKWADPALIQRMKDMGLVIEESVVKKAREADAAWELFWLKFKAGLVDAVANTPKAFQAIGDSIAIPKGQKYEMTSEGFAVAVGPSPAEQARQQWLQLHSQAMGAGVPFAGQGMQRPWDAAASAGANSGWDVQAHALTDFVSKLQQAVQLATENAKQREIDTTLLGAANAKQKDIVQLLEQSGASQDKINEAKKVEITRIDEARRLLGQADTDRITHAVEQQRLNAATQEGQQRIDDLRKIGQSQELQVVKSLEDQNRQLATQASSSEEIKRLSNDNWKITQGRDTILMKITDQLEEEVRIAGLLPDQRDRELTILQAQRQVGRDLTEEEKQRIDILIKERQQVERINAVFDDIDRSSTSVLANFFATGKLDAESFFDSVRRGWAQMLADMIQESYLRPIELQIFGSLKSGVSAIGDLISGGSNGLSGFNVSQLFNGTRGAFNAFNSPGGPLGQPSLYNSQTGGQYPFPDSVQVTPQVYGSNPGGYITGGSGVASAVGGAFEGYGIGSVYGSVTNKSPAKAQNAQIGGALGGAIGSIFGPIGTLVGSLLGSFVGGLFGPGKSNFTATANFNANQTNASFTGDKPNENTAGLSKGVAQGILAEIANLKGYGVSFTDTISQINIGERDRSSYLLGSGVRGTTSSVGDANDLALKAIEALLASAQSSSPTLKSTLAKNTFSSVDELDAAVKFVTQIYDTTVAAKPAATQVEQAMKDMVKSFHDASTQVKALGLDMTAFAAGVKKSFDQDIALSIEQIQDPLKYALDIWQREAQARLNAAASVGGDIEQVRKLNDLLRKQIVDQNNNGVVANLQGLINSVNFGSTSAAAPDSQYFSALSQYNAAKSAALGSGSANDITAFQNAAQAFMPIARNFLGTSQRYGSITADIVQTASQLQAGLTSAPSPVDLQPVVEAQVAGSTAIVEAVQQVASGVESVNQNMTKLGGLLESLARRVA